MQCVLFTFKLKGPSAWTFCTALLLATVCQDLFVSGFPCTPYSTLNNDRETYPFFQPAAKPFFDFSRHVQQRRCATHTHPIAFLHSRMPAA